MAMVNSLSNVKDSRWLQLEVCREYQRNKCTRSDDECKFAHPPNNMDIQNGRVVACYDSIKGRCNRDKPPCKYFHPPKHLKDQLIINGRNHLALKNALLHQMPIQTVLAAGQLPMVRGPIAASLLSAYSRPTTLVQQFVNQQRVQAAAMATANLMNGTLPISTNTSNIKTTSNSYVSNLTAVASPSAYGTFPPTVIPGLISTTDQLPSNFGLVSAPSALIASNKTIRTDRLEVCREFQRGNCKRSETECRFAHPPDHVQFDSNDGLITVCMDFIKSRCSREQCKYFHPPSHLQAQITEAHNRSQNTASLPNASHVLTQPASSLALGKKRSREEDDIVMPFAGMVPLTKRPALEKSDLPVFQPPPSAYQQALAIHQSFVPLALTGHHPNVQRF